MRSPRYTVTATIKKRPHVSRFVLPKNIGKVVQCYLILAGTPKVRITIEQHAQFHR